jgi:hypothetical protein
VSATPELVSGEIIESRTPDQWAALVRADLGQAVAGFIAAGRHLIEAKQQIPHGGWEIWVRQVGISPARARMLMDLSRHPALSNRQHANDLPASWTTLYELSQLDPPLLEAAISAGRVTPQLERKEARALVIEYKTMAAEVSFDLRHCDFRSLDLDAGSIDAIVTDPPYPVEFLPLYLDLSERAAKWLRPGGFCVVMCGQSYLPEVFVNLATHLTYHWTVALLLPGGQTSQIFPRKVNCFWKPIVVLRNGDGDDAHADWFGDVAKSDVNANDKRFHHWGQSESGMSDLVRRLTRPGAMILDPFMGAGTTGVAALALGRSFIGCDVNADHVDDARERLEQTVLERLG